MVAWGHPICYNCKLVKINLNLRGTNLDTCTQRSPRIVPGSEAWGLVAPINFRPYLITPCPSHTCTTIINFSFSGWQLALKEHNTTESLASFKMIKETQPSCQCASSLALFQQFGILILISHWVYQECPVSKIPLTHIHPIHINNPTYFAFEQPVINACNKSANIGKPQPSDWQAHRGNKNQKRRDEGETKENTKETKDQKGKSTRRRNWSWFTIKWLKKLPT